MIEIRVVDHVVHRMSRFLWTCFGCTLMLRSSFLRWAGGMPCAVVLVLWGTCIVVALLIASGDAYIGHAIFSAIFICSLGVSSCARMLACHRVIALMISVWIEWGTFPVRKQSILRWRHVWSRLLSVS